MSATESPTDHHLAIDDLDRAIVKLSARINAETYELLVLIRRFDERVGWLKWGLSNCAEWLAYRCDLSLTAAREKVRVAHALKALPAISMAFSKGELSYSKVRALVRVATRHDEDELLAFALNATAAQTEDRCRELSCGGEQSVDDAKRVFVNRSLRMHRDPVRGMMTITVELPLESGELVDKALDRARDAGVSETPEFADECWTAERADALVAMAGAYLSGNGGASSTLSEHYQVTVHVDSSALAKGKGRSGLPIESVRRLACDGDVITIVEDGQGEPLSVGRKTRTVPTAIKRALWARDRGCSFPGCTHKRFVDAHHIKHWSAGGDTSLDNLTLLCTRHHRLVHEEGFAIEKDYQDRWYFRRPDGLAVPRCGYIPDDMLDDYADATGNTNDSAESLLTMLEISQPRTSPAISA